MNHVRRRGTARSLKTRFIAAMAVIAMFTTTLPLTSSAQTIAQTRAEIAALSATLAQQQRTSESTANTYDAAKVQFATITINVKRLEGRETIKRAAIAATSRQLVSAVVRAYVFGAAVAQTISLFDQPVTSSDARTEYQNQAIGNLTKIRTRFQDEKRSLDSTIAQLAAQRIQAHQQENTMRDLLQQNIRNEASTQATLTAVTQSLKKQIINYEVQVGTAAAKVRDVSQEQAAVAAASAVGGQSAANLVLAAIQAATPPIFTGGTAGSAAGRAALAAAVSQIGVPYVWGGETPGQGFDCSGLVQWAWARAGFQIPRTTETQWPALRHIPLSQLQPGDLLFYYNLDGDHLVDHVVMYAGSGPWGTNTIIAAASAGTRISYAPIFTFGLIGAARP
ncbi:MAG: C40 family peptidase [Acidimicrobiales bacterium]